MPNKNKIIVFVYLFFSSLFVSSCCAEEPSSPSFEKKMYGIMQKYDAVGVSVVLVKDNKIDYVRSFGYNPNYANPQARDSIKSSDIYWIASISKTFIATAIMQMVEKGLLDLDDDINKYLEFPIKNPYFPDAKITVRMLLCHMSSLNGKKVCTNFDDLSPIKNNRFKSYYTEHAPGTHYSYCNIGYNLLAAIIERVSGLRFDDYLDQNILKPLNLYGGYDVSKLDSSRFVWAYRYNQEKKEFLKTYATYRYDEDRARNYVLGYSTPCFWPPGGMKISATDLAKFMLMHMNDGKYGKDKRIITKQSEQEMRKVHNGKTYGLALSHYRNIIKGVELIGMTGGSRGMHSVMFFNPKEKYGFIVICNGCTSKSINGIQMNAKIVREMYNCFIKSDK